MYGNLFHLFVFFSLGLPFYKEIWLSVNLPSYFQASGIASRLKPLFDRVLIMKAEKVTTTKGGIMLPEKSVGKVLEGIVVAIGPGARSKVSI